METRAGIAIVVLLVGCAQPQVSANNAEPIAAVSPPIGRPAGQQRNTPKRLKLRLTLDRPEDLKVRIGDDVIKGQVISDRPSMRAHLIQEREGLQQQLKQLQEQTITSSDAVEQAEVEQARLKVEQARGAIAAFHADSPWTDYARSTLLIPEKMQLRKLQNEYLQAQGELAIAIAKHQTSQQYGKDIVHHSTQEREIAAQLQDIQEKLNSTGLVHSPLTGCLQSIKWLGQTNRDLQIEVTVATAPSFEVTKDQRKSRNCEP